MLNYLSVFLQQTVKLYMIQYHYIMLYYLLFPMRSFQGDGRIKSLDEPLSIFNMTEQIELETVLKGKEAAAFDRYVHSSTQKFTNQSMTLFREARQLSKEWPEQLSFL